jgi:hypothetical protein
MVSFIGGLLTLESDFVGAVADPVDIVHAEAM